MAYFSKKPVVIEAHQIDKAKTDTANGLLDWPDWLVAAWETPFEMVGSFYSIAGALCITTLEGVMTVSDGDWVIKGVKGELYPCKPDIFAATYEPVAPRL
jgi:hypothetical protein